MLELITVTPIFVSVVALGLTLIFEIANDSL
jgi:hypothetical protein